ncbi:phospholipase A2 inhibitor and Ly6/PLAUR domain-containing protein-like, partial [Crotalus tigris]|uniref:phospholipase A2 inhibitor and Ly6/PLAUR domain-containing protein-like n=1 Tax=Crotalus tigris TaxID=88082 RepID=UPI00192F303A
PTLECVVCSDIGTNCTGNLETCHHEQDTCVVILIHNTLGGKAMQTVTKGCESSVVCHDSKTHLNMGNGKILQGSLVCCDANACKTAIPTLPPAETKTNGVRCPACFSETGSCEKELTNCTGEEYYCFHLFTRSYANGELWDSIMEGCTTKETCHTINDGHLTIVERGNTVVINSRCSKAKSKGVYSWEFHPLNFAGFLFLRVFL